MGDQYEEAVSGADTEMSHALSPKDEILKYVLKYRWLSSLAENSL